MFEGILVFSLAETSFATISYSFKSFILVCKLCKCGLSFIHYILKMSRYTNHVYIGRYLVLRYMERFISRVCYFFSYICWSVNCMSWVSKFNIFFLTCRETEARFIFGGFNIVIYGNFSFLDSLILFLHFLSGL